MTLKDWCGTPVPRPGVAPSGSDRASPLLLQGLARYVASGMLILFAIVLVDLIGFGIVIGPALGGALAGSDPAAPNVAAPAFLGAALSGLALLATLVFLRESLPAEARNAARRSRLAVVADMLQRPSLRFLILLF